MTPDLGDPASGEARTGGDPELVLLAADQVVDDDAATADVRQGLLDRAVVHRHHDAGELLTLLLGQVSRDRRQRTGRSRKGRAGAMGATSVARVD